MRLSSAGDEAAAASLLEHAFGIGISSLHFSSEYDTYDLFTQAWRRARPAAPRDISFIAKVASPHFGEKRFSADAFRSKIEAYLSTLGIDRLDVVQWLLRYDLKDEEGRLRILSESEAEVAALLGRLKEEGKIGSCISFPYSSGIASAVLRHSYCDGLALYVNPLEHEMDAHLAEAEALGKKVVAIRPFAAGRLFAQTGLTPDEALRYVLGQPAVATTVVSVSNRAHVDVLQPWLGSGPAG